MPERLRVPGAAPEAGMPFTFTAAQAPGSRAATASSRASLSFGIFERLLLSRCGALASVTAV